MLELHWNDNSRWAWGFHLSNKSFTFTESHSFLGISPWLKSNATSSFRMSTLPWDWDLQRSLGQPPYWRVIHSNGSSLHDTNSETFAILCLLSLLWSRLSTFSNKFPCDNFYRNKQELVKWALFIQCTYFTLLLWKHAKTNH